MAAMVCRFVKEMTGSYMNNTNLKKTNNKHEIKPKIHGCIVRELWRGKTFA